jgi:hypothetical protein
MIIETKNKEEVNTDEVYKKLSEEFNKIAKENKSKFRIENCGTHCTLIKKIGISFDKLSFGNSLGQCDIYYDKDNKGDYFYFLEGIDKETFEEVKYLFEKLQLTQKLKVEVVE